ncbi:MAG TPA: hypothetical protein VII60_08680 [Acidimicrobiales bacterium]
METGWTIYLGLRLPRHYVANHWDVAWVGLDAAQVVFLLLSAWAAWRRRAILIQFANACATLLLVDAWFDVTTSRYSNLQQSMLALAVELPSAFVLLWISQRVAKRLINTWLADTDMALQPARQLLIPEATPKAKQRTTPPPPPPSTA